MRVNHERKEFLKGKHYQHGFQSQDLVFNFFPKGSVPSSGPSKRHNSVHFRGEKAKVECSTSNPSCLSPSLDLRGLAWSTLIKFYPN
ncbi:hypothetical protein Lal_00048237 [Lupinus albus]|nr:hypothetical protein Lal_00048237 [Lupinus albus]